MSIEIVGQLVRLRPFEPDDLALVTACAADAEIARWSPFPLSAERAPYILERRLNPGPDEPPAWVVVDRTTDKACGDISFRWIYPWLKTAAIGYVLLPFARGRGLASEAVRLAARHVLTDLDWPRLELHHAVDNLASCRVATRAGFALEGTMRHSLRYGDGCWHDEHLHARLPGDL